MFRPRGAAGNDSIPRPFMQRRCPGRSDKGSLRAYPIAHRLGKMVLPIARRKSDVPFDLEQIRWARCAVLPYPQRVRVI
jgi:hypothetical protein